MAVFPTLDIILLSTNLLLLWADKGTLICPVVLFISNEDKASLDKPLDFP
jgi:hypothetical protein